MDITLVMNAVIALGLIGVLAALLLATAAKKFHVEVDPRVQEVLDALPGANCGACGRPGCFAAAEAVVDGHAPVTVCVAGGQDIANAIATIMGADECAITAVVSCRHCGGGTNARKTYEYHGVRYCAVAAKMAGGPQACGYGCLGFGDCQRACVFDAISFDGRGLPVVDLKKCTGCAACVTACPRGGTKLLEMVPENVSVAVRCSSKDKVKARRDYCTMSCIACKKCERACPSDAIHVVDMLAVVDGEKCTGCYACVEVCPQDCIDVFGRNAPGSSRTLDGAAGGFEGFASTAPVESKPEGAEQA